MSDTDPVQRSIELLIEGREGGMVAQMVRNECGTSERAAADALKRALKILENKATFSRPVEIGIAKMQLEKIMSDATVLNVAVALGARKELSRLLGIYPEDDDTRNLSPNDEAEKLNTVLAEIDGHLRPLGIAPDDYPIVEVVRIAADLLARSGLLPDATPPAATPSKPARRAPTKKPAKKRAKKTPAKKARTTKARKPKAKGDPPS